MHEPPTQLCPVLHTVPQAPQLFTSMRVSAHASVAPEPQRASGAAHSRPHAPIEQTLPVGQRLPQPPQFSRSVGYWRESG